MKKSKAQISPRMCRDELVLKNTQSRSAGMKNEKLVKMLRNYAWNVEARVQRKQNQLDLDVSPPSGLPPKTRPEIT